MKKLLFSSLCAAALLTACQSEDSVLGGGGNIISDGQDRYLSVNLVSNTGSGTRAYDENPANGENYENGLAAENKVTKVRFYFFDSNGDPAYVKAGKEVNWFDWTEGIGTPDSPDNANLPNVEKILNATIVINTKEGDALPSQILAVVNPREALTDNACTLEEIRTITADYALYANGGKLGETTLSGNYFPMCNSVYADGTPLQRMIATNITANSYKSSADEAKNYPVQIFVERNVAKVRVSMELNSATMTVENGLIKLQSKDKQGNVSDIVLPSADITDTSTPTVADIQVYLKLAGWNVTADMNAANLSKRLRIPLWSDTELGFVWNYPTFHRSYWSAQLSTSNCRYGNFEAAQAKPFYSTTSTGFSSLVDNAKGFTYCNENTIAQGNANYLKRNTKVILAGTLCDKDGKALTICEYYGVKFVDNANQTNLKKSILSYLTDDGKKNYYRKKDNKEIVSISPDDITFEYAKTPTITDSKGLYYVIPALTESANKYTWYSDKETTSDNVVDNEEIDNALRGSQHAKIWNTGMTYYYADINHFGTDNIGGKLVPRRGVVRNHIYDMSINTIYGLGTPVWNPDTEIIPEKTEEEDTYIGAQINILSWRLVKNNVSLEW